MIPSTRQNRTKCIFVPQILISTTLDIVQVVGRRHWWFWTCEVSCEVTCGIPNSKPIWYSYIFLFQTHLFLTLFTILLSNTCPQKCFSGKLPFFINGLPEWYSRWLWNNFSTFVRSVFCFWGYFRRTYSHLPNKWDGVPINRVSPKFLIGNERGRLFFIHFHTKLQESSKT